MLGYLLGQQWTTPHLVDMAITTEGYLMGWSNAEPARSVFLGASADLIQNIHGVARVVVIDGDEIGFLVGKVAELKRHR